MDIRKIVARYARGNVSLMRGRYQTKEDIDKRREKVLKYDFTKGLKHGSN